MVTLRPSSDRQRRLRAAHALLWLVVELSAAMELDAADAICERAGEDATRDERGAEEHVEDPGSGHEMVRLRLLGQRCARLSLRRSG